MPVPIRIPIEIPYALSIFALIFAESITTNWTMYRTCYTTLGFNESDCALLGSGNSSNSTAELEKQVQPYVTVILMVKALTQAVLASMVCFFYGPWSDKYGRRPVLLLSFAGFGMAFAIMSVISALPNLSPWYVILYMLPIGITGGFMAQLTVVLCYITDTTTTSSRGIRLAIFEASSTGGALIGTLSSSFVFNWYGYTIMFIIVTCCYWLSWLMIYLFVPESVSNPEPHGKIRGFFKISLLRESLNATFRKRTDYKRAILLTTISVLLVYVLAFAEFNFSFLYLRKMFKWSLRQYTIYNGGITVTGIMGSLFTVYILHTLFKVNESVMVLLGLLSACSWALSVALATDNWHIYASGGFKFLVGMISPMARSLISKTSMEDSGAVFSFMAVCETLVALLGNCMFTYVYYESFTQYPTELLYYLVAAIHITAIVLNLVLLFIQKQKVSVAVYTIIENVVG